VQSASGGRAASAADLLLCNFSHFQGVWKMLEQKEFRLCF